MSRKAERLELLQRAARYSNPKPRHLMQVGSYGLMSITRKTWYKARKVLLEKIQCQDKARLQQSTASLAESAVL